MKKGAAIRVILQGGGGEGNRKPGGKGDERIGKPAWKKDEARPKCAEGKVEGFEESCFPSLLIKGNDAKKENGGKIFGRPKNGRDCAKGERALGGGGGGGGGVTRPHGEPPIISQRKKGCLVKKGLGPLSRVWLRKKPGAWFTGREWPSSRESQRVIEPISWEKRDFEEGSLPC